MKWLFLFIGTISFSGVYAQGEFLNKSNSIAPSGSGISLPKSNAPSIFSPNMTPSPSKSIIEKKNLEFSKSNDFANPGDPYKAKLNQKESGENYKMFRKNQYLGDFKTTAEHVRISCRDFGEIDGDQIKILVNDKVIVERIFLDGEFRGIQLGLEKGFNRIDFEALNQGSSGPNTAEFRVYDDKGALVSANQWNLATGFKATVIIVKD